MPEPFRAIAEQAHRTNEARADELTTACERWSAGVLSVDERADAAAVAHKLAGSAGTFGYGGVSETAYELEQWLVSRDEPPAGQPGGWVRDLMSGLAGEPDDDED